MSTTLADTVRAQWGADDLLVSFDARGNGFALTPGETWLDSFTVVSGRVVPEPVSATLLLLSAAPLRPRRRTPRPSAH